jgi:hypothetical protein
MTLPRTVADVLTDHVLFEVECIDRMCWNVYVPQLQHAGGLLGYIQRRLGLPIGSTAPLEKITDAFSAAMCRFARDQQAPWADFVKGQRKDDVMHEHLARSPPRRGCCLSAGLRRRPGYSAPNAAARDRRRRVVRHVVSVAEPDYVVGPRPLVRLQGGVRSACRGHNHPRLVGTGCALPAQPIRRPPDSRSAPQPRRTPNHERSGTYLHSTRSVAP